MPVLVHIAENVTLAEMLKDILQQNGIEAAVAPPDGSYARLPPSWINSEGGTARNVCGIWIKSDSDLERARSIVRDFESGPRQPTGWNWRCPQCGEMDEPQFTECWKCGASRKD